MCFIRAGTKLGRRMDLVGQSWEPLLKRLPMDYITLPSLFLPFCVPNTFHHSVVLFALSNCAWTEALTAFITELHSSQTFAVWVITLQGLLNVVLGSISNRIPSTRFWTAEMQASTRILMDTQNTWKIYCMMWNIQKVRMKVNGLLTFKLWNDWEINMNICIW